MKTLQQILNYKNLIAVIQAIKGGVPGDILPAAMLNPTKKIIGATGTYKKVESNRQVAQAVHYGVASKNVKLSGVSDMPVTCIHTFEHFDHEPNTVAQLTSLDNNLQEMGSEEVGRKLRDFGGRFTNLRYAAWYSILFKGGKIWLDKDGNLLASATGAVVTIDYGVPATNMGFLNWDGNGNLISAKWSIADTDIALQIEGVKMAAAVQTGYKIVNAYYGKNVPSFIAKNTTMKEFLKLHPTSNDTVRTGGIPNGFLQLNWIPANTAFFVDATGTTQFFCGNNQVVFTPAVEDAGWWGMIEGSYAIPTNLGAVHGDAMAALNSLKQVNGMFSYATVSHDPVGIRHYGGDTFLPTLNVPKAIYSATVDW